MELPVPQQLKLNLVLPLDETLDTFTAARIAKVTEKTMRDWCARGRVGAWKPIGRWRVERASLYALIESSRNRHCAFVPIDYPSGPKTLDVGGRVTLRTFSK